MTLEIRQSSFPFFPSSLMHMAVISIFQLPGNFFHIWLEALKNLSVHRYNQNLLKAQWACLQWNVSTSVCRDRAGLSLQHLLFLSQGQGREFSGRASERLCRTQGCFELWFNSHSLYFGFFPCQRCRKTWEMEPLCPGSSPPEYRINSCLVLHVTWCWAENRLESTNLHSGVPRSCITIGAQ